MLFLGYFNIFGPCQDPNGAYAAVIPKWIASMINGDPVYINGDGETSRDVTTLVAFATNVLLNSCRINISGSS